MKAHLLVLKKMLRTRGCTVEGSKAKMLEQNPRYVITTLECVDSSVKSK